MIAEFMNHGFIGEDLPLIIAWSGEVEDFWKIKELRGNYGFSTESVGNY